MKLASEDRIIVLIAGLFFAWVAFYMMVQGVYSGLSQVIIASVHGGTYPRSFLTGEGAVIWLGSVFASCIFLAIALMAEKKEKSTGK